MPNAYVHSYKDQDMSDFFQILKVRQLESPLNDLVYIFHINPGFFAWSTTEFRTGNGLQVHVNLMYQT